MHTEHLLVGAPWWEAAWAAAAQPDSAAVLGGVGLLEGQQPVQGCYRGHTRSCFSEGHCDKILEIVT